MRSVIRAVCGAALVAMVAATAGAVELPYYSVLSEDAGAWPAILSSIGLQRQPAGVSRIFVARPGAAASGEWKARVERGAFLILEGESSLADTFGFRSTKDQVKVTSLSDVHLPDLPVIWEKGLELPVFEMPAGAQVFARDRWNKAPLLAGMKIGAGGVLWVEVSPGEHGYERFPYLLSALGDLGLDPPFRSSRLWAFFDSSYRSRADLDYFAKKWRNAGISVLHVAAWHFFEADPAGDRYLADLIQACHREGILVYAWLELPHVSEKFWDDHPAWREKTAVLQDAQLDWRKLMNLSNRDCFAAVSAGVEQLVGRFDWDGINLAELYFESLEGIGNPSRFTPMNADIRREFQAHAGFDPVELFGSRKDEASRRMFLDFRSELARRMQEEWLGKLEAIRKNKTHLDLVLTHVDDRFDRSVRDAIGADASRVLPLLDSHPFTFLVEDPATVWHMGPERYKKIAGQYQELTPHRDKLAIDLNIVDRYQNVYPTKQQTGVELLQLVHSAAENFDQVALYFESSLSPPDLKLLPAAAATVTRIERIGQKTIVESAAGIGIAWRGPAEVDGQPWPAADAETLWLPAGAHTVEPSSQPAPLHLLRLNGELKGARSMAHSIEFSYRSSARAIAVLDRQARHVLVDGAEVIPESAGALTILLPRGQHVVTLSLE
jgi:hypothetical protein